TSACGPSSEEEWDATKVSGGPPDGPRRRGRDRLRGLRPRGPLEPSQSRIESESARDGDGPATHRRRGADLGPRRLLGVRRERLLERLAARWACRPQANETWNATGTATVHGWIQWQLSGPNVTWKEASNFTYTEPVRLFLMSGAVVDVSTPAGAFSAIPVSMGHPELDVTHAGIATDPGDHAMGFDHEVPVQRNQTM